MDEQYPLHKSVFTGNIKEVSRLLREQDVTKKDKHGNTPLHIAVMLGRSECVQLLLAHNAPVKSKNAQGWTSLAEAVSYGHRPTITCLLKRLKTQSRQTLEDRRPHLVAGLEAMDDFYLELKWDFQSWVPFLSRMLPSDVCKIHKKGSQIRMDTTLVDFSDMKWERGDITFLFNGKAKPAHSLVVLDNKKKVFQRIRYQESEQEIEDEVDILMGSDVIVAQMPAKHISFSRTRSGWLFRHDRTEKIGTFHADFYSVHGLNLQSRKRREHLSEEDLKKNKAMMESISKGQIMDGHHTEGPKRRQSLEPPAQTSVTWEEYTHSSAPVHLGRPMVSKENVKQFKATVAMSEDFPMTVQTLLDILEVIAPPFKQFSKLREFMQTRLPPGFPVKLEIPVFPTVSAKITFQEFKWTDSQEESKFTIPTSYSEDPFRFPDL